MNKQLPHKCFPIFFPWVLCVNALQRPIWFNSLWNLLKNTVLWSCKFAMLNFTLHESQSAPLIIKVMLFVPACLLMWWSVTKSDSLPPIKNKDYQNELPSLDTNSCKYNIQMASRSPALVENPQYTFKTLRKNICSQVNASGPNEQIFKIYIFINCLWGELCKMTQKSQHIYSTVPSKISVSSSQHTLGCKVIKADSAKIVSKMFVPKIYKVLKGFIHASFPFLSTMFIWNDLQVG